MNYSYQIAKINDLWERQLILAFTELGGESEEYAKNDAK